MKRIKRIFFWCIIALLVWLQCPAPEAEAAGTVRPAGTAASAGMTTQTGTLSDSPYVAFSPDGLAWTFREGLPAGGIAGKPDCWYAGGETMETGLVSGLRRPGVGEHYYGQKREGMIPVGRWEVRHPHAQCIHQDTYGDFHGVDHRAERCLAPYYSGWFAYCADCGQPVAPILIYGSKKAVSSVRYIDSGLDHYYCCPSCGHLEQGRTVEHVCKAVSYNMYRVAYDGNGAYVGKEVQGYMPDSLHVYNNETCYEGNEIIPNTRLMLNSYDLSGYTFVGWNDEPDGSGTFYEDGAEICNLSTENYDEATGRGRVILYAQWEVTESNLRIDPNGGTFRGSQEAVECRQACGTSYVMAAEDLMPPEGPTVAFESNGGSVFPKQKGRWILKRWKLLQPSKGVFENDRYTFAGPMNHTDTLQAVYAMEPVALPAPRKEGFSFGGWFGNPECTNFVGKGGDAFRPNADVTLYAKWTELQFEVQEVYYRDHALKDWRTAGSLCGAVKDEAGKSDNAYATPGDERAVLHATGAVDLRIRQDDGSKDLFRIWMSDETDPNALNEAYENMKGAERSEAVDQTVWRKVVDSSVGFVAGEDGDYDASYMFETCGASAQVYEVRADGLYVLSAAGGQGGDFGSNRGGFGGEVTVAAYLWKGERLTVMLGGQGNGENAPGAEGGYGGGASGRHGASGGSATRILLTDLSGETKELVVAAGGGGADCMGNGGDATDGYAEAGNLNAHPADLSACGLTEDRKRSDSASAGGGGGGYRNGLAGEVLFHEHSAMPVTAGSYAGQLENGTSACVGWQWISGGTHYGHVTKASCIHYDHLNVVNGVCAQDCRMWDTSWQLKVLCRVCGKQNSPHVKEVFSYACNDCGADLGERSSHEHPAFWRLGCEKDAGVTVDASSSSRGGLSYVDTGDDHYAGRADYDNHHAGNGCVSIVADAVGFSDADVMAAVPARDRAEPDGISDVSFDVEGGRAVISWREPKGNASTVCFFCESYCRRGDSMEKVLTTNILSGKIDTAVAGYYYICNEDDGDASDYLREKVTAAGFAAAHAEADAYTYEDRNAALASDEVGFTKDCRLDAEDVGRHGNRAYDPDAPYVHVAAVDVAGNVSDTVLIKARGAEIPWEPETDPLFLSSVVGGVDRGNVAVAEGERTWYVRADGQTPFLLSYKSRLRGTAREDYQINRQVLDARTEGGMNQRYCVELPLTTLTDPGGALDSREFARKSLGEPILRESAYAEASRENGAAEVNFSGAFTLNGAMDGRRIVVTPVAGADHREGTMYSDWAQDCLHALTIIADGQGPVVSGLDVLEDRCVIDRLSEEIVLEISAEDNLSGVAEFYVKVTNTDHFSERIFTAENGCVRLNVTGEDPLFTGDFTVTTYARDGVGNVTQESRQVTEFALETRIERILEPHAPVFKGGESGILTVITYGYADLVEITFPEEMTALKPELDQSMDFTGRQCYRQECRVQFMVPLYTPGGLNYEVTVRAHKDGRKLEDRPALSTMKVEGSVLDEVRTRLR